MSDPYVGAIHGAANRSVQLDHVLGMLLRQAPDIEAAAVVSFDGLPMASALPASMDEDRVAAMSAALLSLGERAAQGLGRGELSQVYVEGDNGTVFLVSADDEAVLVAVGRHGAKVGLMLFEVKQAAEAVAQCLRIEPEVQAPLVAVAPVEPVPAAEPVAPIEAVAPVAPVTPVAPMQVVPPAPVVAPVAAPTSAPVPALADVADANPEPEREDSFQAPGVVASSNGWNGNNSSDDYRTPAAESGTWT